MKKFILIAILTQLFIIIFTCINYPDHYIVHHYTIDMDLWSGMFTHIADGKIPMVDFGIEYPAGTVTLYWLLYLFYSTKTQFLIFHSIFMLGVFICSLIYLYRIIRLLRIPHSTWIMALYALSPSILMLNHVRFDIVPVTLALAGYYYYKKGRLYTPCILFGIGASIKWFPAFMVIALAWEILFIDKRFFKALKLCIISFLSYALLDLIFIAISYIKHRDLTNWLFSFSANANLSIYSDTIPGLIRIFYGKELATYLPLYIMGGLFLIITIIPYPKSSLPRYILYCFCFLVFNKIYSPQFHMWFLPFLLLYIGQSRYYKSGFIAVILLELVNISIYPFSFSIILEKLTRFELGPLFPILSFRIFTNGIIIRAILLVILSLYIYSPKISFYASGISVVIFLASHINYTKESEPIHKRLTPFYNSIPQGARIATDKTLYPHLKTRFPTNLFIPNSDPDYILLSISPNINPIRWNYYEKMLIKLLANERYGVKRYIRGYVLLEKDISTKKNEPFAKNTFSRFEAEYMPGAGGITIKDTKAQNRLARRTSGDKSGHLVYGPYLPMLPGEYEAAFRLKTNNAAIDQLIARIDVAGKVGQKIYAEKNIYARDFRLADRYQSFRLHFTLPELDRVEFRIYFTGKGDLTVDRIKLYPPHLMSTS